MLSIPYIAGFFDGEGCVSLCYCKRRKRKSMEGYVMGFKLIAGISNTDPIVLLILQAMYGGDLNVSNRKNANPNHKRAYVWKVTGRDTMKAFLSSIEPFVLVKRAQVLLALRYLETMEVPGKRLQQVVWDIRVQCYKEMQALNRRGLLPSKQEPPISPSLGWNPLHRGLSKPDLNQAMTAPAVTVVAAAIVL
jgi:hypothetical protein